MRTFLSPNDPLGFGLADYVEVFAIAILAILIAGWTLAPRMRGRISPEARWWILIFAIFPVVLRLCLLGRSPAPIPSGADDFSFILLADTLRHLRLSNPPLPFPEFFEQVFVLQQPTHSSMYPL